MYVSMCRWIYVCIVSIVSLYIDTYICIHLYVYVCFLYICMYICNDLFDLSESRRVESERVDDQVAEERTWVEVFTIVHTLELGGGYATQVLWRSAMVEDDADGDALREITVWALLLYSLLMQLLLNKQEIKQ